MTNVSLRNLICGFIAGAIAVMTVHEVVNFLLLELGLFHLPCFIRMPEA